MIQKTVIEKELRYTQAQSLTVPKGAILLNVQKADSFMRELYAYFLVTLGEQDEEERHFEVIRNGDPMDASPGIQRQHLASVQTKGTTIHVFERLN